MAMASISGDDLVVTIKGIRKLGTMKSELSIPLAKVRGATFDPALSTGWPGLKNAKQWPGIKVLGTDAYGRYLGGTFSQEGERVFWDVAKPENAIVITVDNDEFTRLIIEVEHPEDTVRQIEAALARRA